MALQYLLELDGDLMRDRASVLVHHLICLTEIILAEKDGHARMRLSDAKLRAT
jgi:hypothetical protein